MRLLKVVLVLVALCGAAARWGLGAHYHFGFGGWPEVWRQEFYVFEHTKCVPCAVVPYVVGWLYSCAPYIAIAIGGIFLRSFVAVGALVLLTIALISLNVNWYFTSNSRDWYLALSPLILTPMGLVCLFIARMVGKFVSRSSPSQDTAKASGE